MNPVKTTTDTDSSHDNKFTAYFYASEKSSIKENSKMSDDSLSTDLVASIMLKTVYEKIASLPWIVDIANMKICEVDAGIRCFSACVTIANPFIFDWVSDMAKQIANENGLNISQVNFRYKPYRTIWQVIRGER